MKTSLFKKVTSMACAAAMLATMGVSAFAATANTDVDTANQAYLVKYLELADGTTNPNEAFNFTFTSVNGAPAVANQTITPATATAADDGASVYGAKSFKDILASVDFPNAGTYQYLVAETAGSTAEMTYDNSVFLLSVSVKNTSDGGLEIGQIIASEVELNDDGTPKTNDDGSYATGAKVDLNAKDPTDPDGDGTSGAPTGDTGTATTGTSTMGVTYYGLTFDNNYQKTVTNPVTPNPSDPTAGSYGALGVAKTITGSYANKTQKFIFSVQLTLPANYTGAAPTAYVYNGTTKGSAVTANYDAESGLYTYNPELSDGDALVFDTLPAGTEYTVTEKQDANYKAEVTIVQAGVKGSTDAENDWGVDPTMNTAVRITDATGANVADVENIYNDDANTPTGILINNAPYIVLAVIAIGGSTAYIVKRRRVEE